jgi:integrase
MGKVLSQVLNPILDELGIRAKLEEMGITRCGNYAFRHMNVTEMRRMGVPLKTIQQRVGHAQGSDITDRHYVHAVDSDNLAASDLIGNLLSTKTEGRVQ